MSKEKVRKEITKFFKTKHSAREVKKIKRLAMRNLVKLGKFRKKFCKKCYSMDLRVVGIKKGVKRVECEDCGYVGRYKIKN